MTPNYTSHLPSAISIPLFLIIFFCSCKKEPDHDEALNAGNTKASTEYLKFDSKEKMKQCITELIADNLEDPLKVLNKYQAPENFRSYQTSKRNKNKAQTELSEKTAQTEWNEDLVPDPYFANILNDKLEVQIENTVVKVTKYGTFLCMPDKLPRVYNIIKEFDKNPPSSIDPAGPQTESYVRPARQMDTGVVYLPSSPYERPIRTVTPLNPLDADPEEDDNQYVRPSRFADGQSGENVIEPLSSSTYDAFASYDYDAKTWAGSLIQDIFGRTKPHFGYFDDKHRVKVNFYNVNFGVYAAAGINVKMQTKGWTGIWRKLETEEMRLGWDGLILKFKMPNMPQPNVPKIDFGKLKIGSIDFPIESITIGGNNITDKVKDALNGTIEGQLRNALKTIWDYVYNTLAPGQLSAGKKYIKAFKVVYNDEVVLALGRYEERALNVNAITKTFDWNVGFTIKWSPQGDAVNLADFSGGPNSYEYEIKGGSVYGAAKYYGNWKGARVEKK